MIRRLLAALRVSSRDDLARLIARDRALTALTRVTATVRGAR